MATYKGIEQELKDAKAEYGKVVEKLNDWEEKENKGKWLNELRMKLFNEEWKDGGEKKKWEDKVNELEEEKKGLEEKEGFWRGRVEKLQDALVAFGGGEGNEQIA